MRKILYIFLVLLVSFIFINVDALTIEELPPIIKIDGMDTSSYEIEKTITEDNVTINFKNKNNDNVYAWSFNKNKVAEIINLNFELKFQSAKKALIDKLTKQNTDKFYLSFTHHGDLPGAATMKVYVGNKYKDGKELYLYYYNEQNDTIEYVSEKHKVVAGYVEFKIKHCSEYFLTGAVVNNEITTPKALNYVIGVLFLIVFILVSITLFSTKR